MVTNLQDLNYEVKTQEIAKELLQSNRVGKTGFLSQMLDQMKWDDKLLGWAMSNPNLRVQLFRFIDSLPTLQSKSDIARHLREYLSEEQVELPSTLKGILNFSSPSSLPAQIAATTVTTAVETLAQKYIAGETLKGALKSIERLRKERMTFTIDLLGEAVITEIEAQSYLEKYLTLITELTQAILPDSNVSTSDYPLVQVSVKLTAFYSQFDPLDKVGSKQKVCDRLRVLLRHAKDKGAAVHFDMEQYEYKDVTLSILQELLCEDEFKSRSDVGITIQAYLVDSSSDLANLITWVKQRGTPLTIRLVKGAYWDQETIKATQKGWPIPVFQDKAQTDLNFEKLTQLLLENYQFLYPAIASHNVRSQAKAIAIAETLNIPCDKFELQVLYGMGEKLALSLVKKGYQVRVYCPYGELIPGMAYLIRRLLENTANSSFLRQNLEDRPIEDLIAPPELGHPTALSIPYPNVPDTDYAKVIEQSKAFDAFVKVRQELGNSYYPIINGKPVNTLQVVDSVNPSQSSQVLGRIGLISITQADQAIEAAVAAYPKWKKTPVVERANILRKAADIMEGRRAELSAWIVLEVGKPLREADGEVSEAIDFCRYYAKEMERLDWGYDYDLPGETNHYRYQGRGIALVISPWNFPLAIATGMTVAALVTGNCTLLKPAEVSSIIAAKLAAILQEAGIPDGVFQFIPGKGSTVGAHLVKHPAVHLIAFTGSQEVGCNIYANAAILQSGQKHLKRVIAEMGGKNSIIVDSSADLDQAVAGIVHSAFGYSGQKCSACSRVIVLEDIYPNLRDRLVEATRSLNIGAAELPSTQVGPVIDHNAQTKIKEYIELGKTEAEVALERTAPSDGYFVGPVIFTQVPPTAKIAQEEIFGPVLSVIIVKNFDEALSVANNTNFALTGGLYSRTPSHIERAKVELEVGNLYINRGITGAIVSRQPFGGFKLSGVGSKAGGPDYLLQFLEPIHVTENVQRQGFAPILTES